MIFAIMVQLMHIIRMNDLDDTDIRLLRTLQQNAQLTSEKLGEALNLSPSQTGRRRQRLEKEGYVEGYRARLSARRLGLSVQAFVTVQMATHAPDKVRTFTRIVDTRPEIVSAWTMTGEADYLLRVYCRDLGRAACAAARGAFAEPGGGAGAKPDRDGSVQGGWAFADLGHGPNRGIERSCVAPPNFTASSQHH